MIVQDKVKQLLIDYPKLRENDNLLIAYYIRDVYGVSNTFDIALMTSTNIYESIRRTRQKVQEVNPMLRPSADVEKARREKEARVREEVRGV